MTHTKEPFNHAFDRVAEAGKKEKDKKDLTPEKRELIRKKMKKVLESMRKKD
jgi:hypothetical protein